MEPLKTFATRYQMRHDLLAHARFPEPFQMIGNTRSARRVIRVLIHYYAGEEHQTRHVYLGAAKELRADLQAAQ